MNLNHIAKKPFFDLFYKKPCMPQMLRAALYDATLLGSNGQKRGASGTLALQNQLAIAQSKELNEAVKSVKDIKREGNHITTLLSHADLIQLGGYAAVEYCGGPAMIFQMGRKDVSSEGDAVQHAPESHAGSLVTSGLSADGDLSPEEFVALMGSFTIGFRGEDRKGPQSRWTQNPFVFDNSYFQELLLRDQSKYYRSEADLKLVQTAALQTWVQAYADDQDLFFRNYAKAHVKVSEAGQEANLLSEMQPEREVDGGYLEESRLKRMVGVVRTAYGAYLTGQTYQEALESEEDQRQIEEK